MLGAIIGDIVGSRWEFSPTNDYNFEWLSEDNNSFTDDTICTVAVADALLHDKDFGETIHKWCNLFPNPKGGYGGRFKMWVLSGYPVPYNSYGNGSAMRVSPVAHWFGTMDDVLDAAAATALPSHNHDEGIKGAQTVALKIISMSTCYEDAVRLAVSLGADADTLGAIVGSIAEAIWGIPMSQRNEIMDFIPEEMKNVIRDFYQARRGSFQPLVDTTYNINELGKDENGHVAMHDQERVEKRRLMAERAKARITW